MDYLKKNRLLILIIAVLLLVNVGTISFILFFRGEGDRFPGKKGRGAVVAFIEKELHLSDAQKEQFARLREEHFGKTETLMREQHEARKAMLGLLREDTVDVNEMHRMAAVMGQKETELAVSTFEHFRALRSLCSPDQQREFDAIIQDVLKMTRPSRGDGSRVKVPRESGEDSR
jgi:Spy/CpxP family protein refolding chaperone